MLKGILTKISKVIDGLDVNKVTEIMNKFNESGVKFTEKGLVNAVMDIYKKDEEKSDVEDKSNVKSKKKTKNEEENLSPDEP
jgi:hypothetical protein